MFCKRCGKKISCYVECCPFCGFKTNVVQTVEEANNIGQSAEVKKNGDEANVGIIALCILVPLLGIGLGIYFLCKRQKKIGLTYFLSGILSCVVKFFITGLFTSVEFYSWLIRLI